MKWERGERVRQDGTNIDVCIDIILSEEFVDLIKDIRPGIELVAKELGVECYQQLTDEYGVFHIEVNQDECVDYYFNNHYSELPSIYGLTSTRAMESAGISPVLNSESLDLKGKGVLIAILDTGIDYTHEAFLNGDKTTRIVSLWDQSIIGTPPKGFLYGTEYSNKQINEALRSEDPTTIVPSTDDVGHGTFLAGIAAGKPNEIEDFQGAAPDSELIIVKLKQAKKCLMDYYQFNEEAVGWQTNDIIQGINYVVKKALEYKKPMAILFAGGSNDGPHNGTNLLEKTLDRISANQGIGVIVAAGNEGNTAHHYKDVIKKGQKTTEVEFNVAEGERGLYLKLWGNAPDKLGVEFISPSGATTGQIPFLAHQWQQVRIALEVKAISVYYDMEVRRATESISVILHEPMPGLWTMIIHGDIVVNGEFDIWMPIKGFISDDTIFLNADSEDTIVSPGTAEAIITVGAYNDVLQKLFVGSSKGLTRDKRIKPDLVAPGVNVIGPYTKYQYTYQTGTSISAAVTVGAAALLLEWGVVKGNEDRMNTIALKAYLARGARRKRNINYPNGDWGFGELDLINTFRMI
ncbi:S8 family peptidase [Vallitalea okinawensis]|uniref:S8 family peptidase n=1 Tax=Vallitalea okinawensis TaxID=2078660 RepID=UPI000CFD0405|nr:S8 family peptidase [Vallitalea okinawensis]